MDLLLLLLMLLVSRQVSGNLRRKCPLNLEHQDGSRPWSHYSPGDHLIGIVRTEREASRIILSFSVAPSIQSDWNIFSSIKMLLLIFAIQMVNKNSQLLHNRTVGYNIHDNYLSPFHTSDALLDIVSVGEANVPNYGCGRKENLLALLDGAARDISIQISTLTNIYKIPQISDRIASEVLSDKSNFPFFYRMAPKEGFHYPAIVQLLLHFRWTLIGLFASGTEQGENFIRTFPPMLVRNGICVVISQQFSTIGYAAPLREALSKWRQANVFVHFMEQVPITDRILSFHSTLKTLPGTIEGKVWILTNFVGYKMKKNRLLEYIHSIWIFRIGANERPMDAAFEPYFFVETLFQDLYFRCHAFKACLFCQRPEKMHPESPTGDSKEKE